jgi:hypothetical protein
MVKVEYRKDYEDEYLQCSSCLCDNTDTTIYRIIVGKNDRQTTTLKLCANCLKELQTKITNIGNIV